MQTAINEWNSDKAEQKKRHLQSVVTTHSNFYVLLKHYYICCHLKRDRFSLKIRTPTSWVSLVDQLVEYLPMSWVQIPPRAALIFKSRPGCSWFVLLYMHTRALISGLAIRGLIHSDPWLMVKKSLQRKPGFVHLLVTWQGLLHSVHSNCSSM